MSVFVGSRIQIRRTGTYPVNLQMVQPLSDPAVFVFIRPARILLWISVADSFRGKTAPDPDPT